MNFRPDSGHAGFLHIQQFFNCQAGFIVAFDRDAFNQ